MDQHGKKNQHHVLVVIFVSQQAQPISYTISGW